MRIAVIGAGISGIAAAWALSDRYHVTLYEAAPVLGGHSRTLTVDVGEHEVAVDTGFIVYNERNYPQLVQLFSALGVESYDSDMSFSVTDHADGFSFAGSPRGLFPSTPSLVDRRRWAILRGILAFRAERQRLVDGDVADDQAIGRYLVERGYPAPFIDDYLIPLATAVWSGTRNSAENMSARNFLAFLDNHGLIGLDDRPRWRTVRGGAIAYVERAAKEITSVRVATPVTAVERSRAGVVVTSEGQKESFDVVVFATHADVTLRILGTAASRQERTALGAFRYERNEVVLHSDPSPMPADRRRWASWNAIRCDSGHRPVGVTYWMNRLQDLSTDIDLFVSLNAGHLLDDDRVLDRWSTMHPQFDGCTNDAQAAIGRLQGLNRTWYAGAYLGYGFHEDGARSGFDVARALGSPPYWSGSSTGRAVGASRGSQR
ncbi:MAG: FAD-dependent oxidoreductase [Acidimicrobiia bacterium]|nr:FAD-dependent oxidoreductase [Acidimicrobiia bacterium]